MSYIFPAGTYVIGDPCYNLSSKQFDELLATTSNFKKEGTITLEDGTVVKACSLRTANGDGRYRDSARFEYAVDSASIGIIPLAAVRGGIDEVDPTTKVVKFKRDFEVYDSVGTLVFGHVQINTHRSAEEDNTEEEGDDDDDDGFGF